MSGNTQKRYGWEASARRTLLSEKRDLESLPGFWVRARKYSIAAADEIRAAHIRKRDTIPPKVRALMSRSQAEGKALEALVAEAGGEAMEDLISQIPPEASSMSGIMRACIRHGLGEHNLEDQDTQTAAVDDALVDRIMDFPAAADEIFAIVQEWNSPLAQATPPPSPTSPSGPSREPPSPPAKSSPTAPTPPA